MAVAFFYPLTRLFSFDIGGNVFGQDLVGIGLLVALLSQKGSLNQVAQIKPLLVMLALWLLGQIATDIYRDTPWDRLQRGWLKIIFFSIQIMAMWLFLSRRRTYLIAFVLGHAVTGILWYYKLEGGFLEKYWKFGVGEGVGLLVAVVFSGAIPGTKRLRPFAGPALIAVGFFLLFRDYRSGFIEFFAAGLACLALLAFEKAPVLRQAFNRRVFAVALLLSFGIGDQVSELYANLADSGTLGAEAQRKYRWQSSGDLSILLGGRTESLVSLTAIADSPILGHGSWAENIYYVRLLRMRLRQRGVHLIGGQKSRQLIPTHSHLFGAWVEAGIAGGLFWIYVIYLLISALYLMVKLRIYYFPLVASTLAILVWNIPFSPFGGEVRFSAAFGIVIALLVRHSSSTRVAVHPTEKRVIRTA